MHSCPYSNSELIDISSRQIAGLYRKQKLEQTKQPIEQQWRYGLILKTLKAAYRVAIESEEAYRR